MPSKKVTMKASMTNQTSHFGIMGGLINRKISGKSNKNRVTSRLEIPVGAKEGYQYMKKHNILSKNPLGSGGVGKMFTIRPRGSGLDSKTLPNKTINNIENNLGNSISNRKLTIKQKNYSEQNIFDLITYDKYDVSGVDNKILQIHFAEAQFGTGWYIYKLNNINNHSLLCSTWQDMGSFNKNINEKTFFGIAYAADNSDGINAISTLPYDSFPDGSNVEFSWCTKTIRGCYDNEWDICKLNDDDTSCNNVECNLNPDCSGSSCPPSSWQLFKDISGAVTNKNFFVNIS